MSETVRVLKRKNAKGAGRPRIGESNPRGGADSRVMVGMARWLRDALYVGALRNHRGLQEELVERYGREVAEVRKVRK